jgi:hypothetical protein
MTHSAGDDLNQDFVATWIIDGNVANDCGRSGFFEKASSALS